MAGLLSSRGATFARFSGSGSHEEPVSAENVNHGSQADNSARSPIGNLLGAILHHDRGERPNPIPPGDLTRLSAGWSGDPDERQIAERVRVLAKAKQAAIQRDTEATTPKQERRRARMAAQCADLADTDIKSAMLGLLSAAVVFRKMGYHVIALDCLLSSLRFSLLARVAVQLGQDGFSSGKCLEWATNKLRCERLIEKSEHRAILRALDKSRPIPSVAEVEPVYKLAFECCDVFEPWAKEPVAIRLPRRGKAIEVS